MATSLTVVSIALSVTLLLGVEALRRSARESFASTISQTDLIVGARGGSLQLLLTTVFRIGQPNNNISMKSYEAWAKHPAVAWTIPISLGDSHRGFRVVGTDENFYRHYRFRRDRQVEFAEGRLPQAAREVVLGAEVARSLGYTLGKQIVLTHGMGAAGIMDHDDKPFTVVGLLARTATPIDRSIYITLEGVEAIHEGWEDGAAPLEPEHAEEAHAEEDHDHDHEHAEGGEQITAFLLRSKNRPDSLRLLHEINTFEAEPLTAILPGVTMSELWGTVSYVEGVLRVISIFVVGVGLLGMLVAIYTTLNERRREMAILRAVGAGPGMVAGLFVLESLYLAAAGAGLGLALHIGSIRFLQDVVEQKYGLFLRWEGLAAGEIYYLAALLGVGLLLGFVPAWRAYRNSLADGLSVKV
ncbi:MAG: ABC transporter permease [Bryobacter sp.]